MQQGNTARQPGARKVRLWPGLRLEICGKNADARLTPDEALGLANHIILEAREAIHQAHHQPQERGLMLRVNPDGADISMWGQNAELVASLTRSQAESLARVAVSKSGAIQFSGEIKQFQVRENL